MTDHRFYRPLHPMEIAALQKLEQKWDRRESPLILSLREQVPTDENGTPEDDEDWEALLAMEDLSAETLSQILQESEPTMSPTEWVTEPGHQWFSTIRSNVT